MPTLEEARLATPVAPPSQPPPSGFPPWRHTWLILFSVVLRAALVLVQVGQVVVVFLTLHHRIFPPRPVPPWHHEGVIARPGPLTGSSRIYLVQMGGHTDPYEIVELAAWLREKYALDVQILEPTGLDPAARQTRWQGNYVAERLLVQIKRDHPALAADPHAILIGFTDVPIASSNGISDYLFTQRDTAEPDARTAIISSSRMALSGWQRRLASSATQATQDAAFNDRLRRILLKDTAILDWHLALNNDPGSLLYWNFNPAIANDDLYDSDLDPAAFAWGAYVNNPCLVFTYTAAAGLARAPETSRGAVVRDCDDPTSVMEPQSTRTAFALPAEERIELRLNQGLLAEKHADAYLPGSPALYLERTLTNQYERSDAFGISGSHNYDRYLSTSDAMRHIAIEDPDSQGLVLTRTPQWLSNLSLTHWSDRTHPFHPAELRWFGGSAEHFELSRPNGEVESYLPCNDAQTCLLSGYRDPSGVALVFHRDALRRLTSLDAPGGRWLHLAYDASSPAPNRLAQIDDSSGQRVLYRYNQRGQLSQVLYSSGEAISYTYDTAQNLLTVSASAHPGAESTRLMSNAYQNGRLTRQTLPDGGAYSYDYLPEGVGAIQSVQITTPDGTTFQVGFGSAGAAIRNRTASR